MTKFKRHKLQEGYFSVQGRFCADSYSEKSDPKLSSRRRGIPSGSSSVSNIRLDVVVFRPDDENFPSECPSVSRNFKLFKIASVRT
jgi:hypothetical protein